MADHVIEKSDKNNHDSLYTGDNRIQPKCPACVEDEKILKKEDDELVPENQDIQKKPAFESEDNSLDTDIQTKSYYETNLSGINIQTKCNSCEQENIQLKKDDELPEEDRETETKQSTLDSPHPPEDDTIQTKSENSSEISGNFNNQLNSSKGKGHFLSADVQNSMGSAFGADFSNVKIHTDSEAVQMNKELGAQAFTNGSDIYFNEGKYDPSSNRGKHLLAHELTHTIQQGNSVKLKSNAPVIQKLGWDDVWDATGGRVVSGISRGARWVGDRASDVYEYGRDWIISQAEKLAPNLLRFLRGNILDYIKTRIVSALDSRFGGIISRIQNQGLANVLGEAFGNLISSISDASGQLTQKACKGFASIAGKLLNVIKSLTGKALEKFKSMVKKAKDFFSMLWNDFGLPAFNFLKLYAGRAWDFLEQKARELWDWTAPVRSAIGRVWQWIKDAFNIAWDSAGSVWDWLKDKISAAWEKVKEKLQPIIGPLKVVAAILVILSPVGPIVIIWKGAPYLWQALKWVAANFNEYVIVRARNYLRNTIIPWLQSGIQILRGYLNSAISWIHSIAGSIYNALAGLVNAVRASSIFRYFSSVLQTVYNAVRSVLDIIRLNISILAGHISSILSDIWEFIRPFVIVLTKIVFVIINPWTWPLLLAAWGWRILPDCFKGPIIDFVIGLMITLLQSMPDFRNFGDSWAEVKRILIEHLQNALQLDEEQKIEISNRIATMISELDLAIIGNQIAAIREAPQHFTSQMQQELIGMDLNQPLPFERTSMPDTSSLLNTGSNETDNPDLNLLSRRTLTSGDIVAEPMGQIELSQELLQEAGLQNGGEVEFGDSNDSSRTIQSIFGEISQNQPINGQNTGTPTNGQETDMSENRPDRSNLSHEELTEIQLQEMMAQEEQPDVPCGQNQTPPSQENATMPDSMKIGPLTQGQRGRYMMHQMWKGVKRWFNCNKNWLIPTLIGVVVALIVTEILTGGLISAALPVIMEVLGVIMIGVAIVRSAIYLAQYISKSIAGDVTGAAQALARSVAVAALELVFALLFGSSAGMKSIKAQMQSFMKTARNVRATVGRNIGKISTAVGNLGRATLRTGRSIVSGLKSTRGAFIKNGKLVMRGISERIGRGARSLRDLASRLYRRVRFRRFKLTFRFPRLQLWGYINPWVLMANGTIEEISQADLDSQVKGATKLGSVVNVRGQKGIVIGASDEASNLTRFLQNNVLHGGNRLEINQALAHQLLSNPVRGGAQLYNAAADVIVNSSRIADDIVRSGATTADQLRDVISNAFRNGNALLSVESLLYRLNRLSRFRPSGLNSLISDLAHPWFEKVMGAEWVLKYITDHNSLVIASLRCLEDTSAIAGRRVDAVINGLFYEFKNLGRFRGDKFVEQIAKEFHQFKTNMRMSVRWVFNDRIGTREALIQSMKAALRNSDYLKANNLTKLDALRIRNLLDKIVIVTG